MVLPLGPGKFYGTSLPRPRIYTDVKFSDERVDPPTPVNDPLLSWANDAHWSMGGLSFNRLRLQGKIEGNVKKLRIEQEKSLKNSQTQTQTPQKSKSSGEVKKKMKKGAWRKSVEDSPPPAPVSRKMKLRSRTVSVEDDDEDEDVEEEMGTVRQKRRRLMRKLGDEFEMVAGKSEKSAEKTVTTTKGGPKTRGRKMVLTEEEEVEDEEEAATDAGTSDECVSVSPNGKRSSPRLKKNLK